MSNDWFRHNIWNPALIKTALGFRVTPHGLRHAHASWLLAGGADLQVVKERLGHGSITTTEKYLHTLPTHHDAALSALDNIRTPTPPEPENPTPISIEQGQALKAAPPIADPTEDGSPTRTPDNTDADQLATVIPLPTAAVNPADVLQNMDPELVRQVLAGLLQQIQPAKLRDTEGTA